jgi:hypothetical protein
MENAPLNFVQSFQADWKERAVSPYFIHYIAQPAPEAD